MRITILHALVILTLLLSGCTLFSDKESNKNEHPGWSAKEFYFAAKESMQAENWEKAISYYEIIQTRFPYGVYATQAQLDIAYAYYKFDEPDQAIAAAERFIKLHPTNEHVDYAYYLKALVNYNRGVGFLERFLPTDSSQRDPGAARDSFKGFETLIRKFPNSRYVDDSRQRMVALRNNLAMYEIHVARYYIKREAFVAAADRGIYVIEHFQRTPAVPLALKMMEKAYNSLGLKGLADDAARVYAYNYANGIPNYQELDDDSALESIWTFFGMDE